MAKARSKKTMAKKSMKSASKAPKKAARKNAVIKKAKAFLGTKKRQGVSTAKKASSKKTSMKKLDQASGESLYMNHHEDKAHSPGHRHMNLKEQFNGHKGAKTHPQSRDAMNKMNRAEKIQRTSATNRRIITGAAVGKTGQITIK